MGSPKALLRDGDGRTFVTRIILTLLDAAVTRVVVVTGVHHDAIVDAIAREHLDHLITIVRNDDPDRGQLSSLWCGMDEVCTSDTPAFAATLVDIPAIRSDTVRTVVDAWSRTRQPIVRPRVGVRRGHPVIFDRAVFDELRRAPLDGGARVVVRAHAADVLDVPVDDPGCIVDVDTPADYRTFQRQ